MISGPGYDINANPVPSGSGPGGFLDDVFKRPDTWKTGPLDARWDDDKKIWIATGGGASIIAFSLTSGVSCELCQATADVLSRPVGVASVEQEVAGQVTVFDYAGCFLDEPIEDLFGRKGYAALMTGPEFCAIEPEFATRWEITMLCCNEGVCV